MEKVYPRGCGGAVTIGSGIEHVNGLSPRVRGSRVLDDRTDANLGSIPAGAGEPECGLDIPSTFRVYPRGCGGASRGIDTLTREVCQTAIILVVLYEIDAVGLDDALWRLS